MDSADRQIVVVSGAPGSGKTTLARPLAARLGYALISKDDLKETLFDALDGPVGDLTFSRKVGGAAMDLLWVLAEKCPRVILEANFRPNSEHERNKMAALTGPIVEVYCSCPAEECARRYRERAEGGSRHSAHVLRATVEMMSEYATPVGIGQLLNVDTSRPVNVEALEVRIREAFVQLG